MDHLAVTHISTTCFILPKKKWVPRFTVGCELGRERAEPSAKTLLRTFFPFSPSSSPCALILLESFVGGVLGLVFSFDRPIWRHLDPDEGGSWDRPMIAPIGRFSFSKLALIYRSSCLDFSLSFLQNWRASEWKRIYT